MLQRTVRQHTAVLDNKSTAQYTTPHHTALLHSTAVHGALPLSALLHSAAQHSAVQYPTAHYATLLNLRQSTSESKVTQLHLLISTDQQICRTSTAE